MIEEFNQREHEEKLRKIIKRLDNREIDSAQMRCEVNRLCGESGFFSTLKEHLMSSVNQQISDKQKAMMPNVKEYFKFRETKEKTVIEETRWSSFFDDCTILSEPLEDVKTLSDFDLGTYQLIIIQALKDYIDEYRENTFNCQQLYQIYLTLKAEAERRFPDYPKGDGFTDYIASRKEREHLGDARKLGDICIHCSSTNIRSNGDKWSCRDCKRSFRKH